MSSHINRRNFLKKGLMGVTGATALPSILGATDIQKKEASVQKKEPFIYRTLGKTGIKLPIISMGVMNASNPNLVEAALDAGIFLLDTAHGYQRGRNEEMIGQVIKSRPRDSFIVATKVGYSKDRRTGLYPAGTTETFFQKEFDISLKRLGLDHVDILYIHSIGVRETVFFEPAMKFLEKAKKKGTTRFMGLTTHSNEHEIIQAAIDSKFYEVVLSAYNFRKNNREEVRKAMAKAAKAGLGIVAMKTQSGVFWDKEKQQPINMKAALKWALQDENVHTAIPGFTSFDQLTTDLSVMENLALTPEEKADLEPRKEKSFSGLFCQQCEACLSQCPGNIDIPTLMRSYMYAYGYGNPSLARETLDTMDLSDLTCNDCSSCLVRCSMGFDVKNKILDIARIKTVPEEFLI